MSDSPFRKKSTPDPAVGPVVPGSVLYRLLQQIARVLAKRLAIRSEPIVGDEEPRPSRSRSSANTD